MVKGMETVIGKDCIKPAVVKRVKLPDKTELLDEGKGEKGDIVLVKVVELPEDAFLKYIRTPENQKVYLKKGDSMLSVLSDRYAARLLNGHVPKHLKKGNIIDLIQQGGESGIIKSTRSGFVKTKLKFLGFVARNGKKMNIMDFALPMKDIKQKPKLIVVVGVNMEAGKTTTTAELCAGLVKKGQRVGAGKITGIGSVYDTGKYLERGANKVYGILDAGCPSSANLSMKELDDIFMRIYTNLAAEGPDYVILEIADGILQRETAMLLDSKVVKKYDPRYILSCNDSLGAYGGKLVMHDRHKLKPILITGMGTITDLGRGEVESIAGIKALDPINQSEEMTDFVINKF
jgi:hypothetical protein